jgi:signal peptidase I
MREQMIGSARGRSRGPLAAFLLSFFFTGLGQLYNGEAPKAAVLLCARILCLLLIPGYEIFAGRVPFLHYFVSLSAAGVLVWIAAFAEAPVRAAQLGEIIPRRYNTPAAYAAFAALALVLLAVATAAALSTVRILRVPDAGMYPTFEKGELVLVSTLRRGGIARGDAVVFREGGRLTCARAIALEGDSVDAMGGLVMLNGAYLSMGIFSDAEVHRLAVKNSERLYYEVNGDVRYPVLANIERFPLRPPRGKPGIVPRNNIVLARDNRVENNSLTTIEASRVRGTAEGVLIGAKLGRSFLTPSHRVPRQR